MGITLVLKLVSSEVNPGFTVWLQVRNDSQGVCLLERVGHLPADPQLEDLYHHWQTRFRSLIHQGRNAPDFGWEFDDIPSNQSRDSDFDACRNYIRLLEENMDRWLESCTDPGWQQIQRKITFYLGKHSDDVRLVIQSDSQLWKLPWLAWNLLDLDSPTPEKQELGIGFSPVEYQKLEALNRGETPGNSVRILAVFGSGENLDLEPDRMALKQLADAEVETLNEPSGRELIEKIRDAQGWDILCFSGHSQTQGRDGILYINQTQSLELREFQEALKTAISRGLKLAIFNSCDGLGLAQKLATLTLPVAIVMKEPVPDAVAQCFLKVFLREYAAGVPLYTAVRRSQIQLESFHDEFPGCSSLPIICQNPAEVPPTWAELSQRQPIVSPPEVSPEISPIPRKKSPTRIWQKLGRILGTSLAIALFVLSAQWHGKLQTWELSVFDHLMRLLPPEQMDDRLLIVGADARDLRQYGYPLPDAILAEVIAKINQYHPAAIGLNITRENPIENSNYPGGHQDFLTQINSSKDHLVSVCSYSNQLEQSTMPLPGLLDSEHQVGFIDVYRDQELTQTQEVRRYILSRSDNAVPLETLCHTRFSLALQLFERYLKYHSPVAIDTPDENWKFGSLLIPALDNRTVGYQNLKGYGQGSQILIRYRHTLNPNQMAPQIRLQDILEETRFFKPDKISGKVVLIGVTDPIEEKLFLTPYGQVNQLSLHAHVVSQLISAFEDTVVGKNQRPLIWWWPQWVNMLWILGWSFLGGFLLWLFPHPIHQWMAMSSAILGLYGICWLLLIQGGWIPLVPALLTLVAQTLIGTFLTLSKIKSLA